MLVMIVRGKSYHPTNNVSVLFKSVAPLFPWWHYNTFGEALLTSMIPTSVDPVLVHCPCKEGTAQYRWHRTESWNDIAPRLAFFLLELSLWYEMETDLALLQMKAPPFRPDCFSGPCQSFPARRRPHIAGIHALTPIETGPEKIQRLHVIQ